MRGGPGKVGSVGRVGGWERFGALGESCLMAIELLLILPSSLPKSPRLGGSRRATRPRRRVRAWGVLTDRVSGDVWGPRGFVALTDADPLASFPVLFATFDSVQPQLSRYGINIGWMDLVAWPALDVSFRLETPFWCRAGPVSTNRPPLPRSTPTLPSAPAKPTRPRARVRSRLGWVGLCFRGQTALDGSWPNDCPPD